MAAPMAEHMPGGGNDKENEDYGSEADGSKSSEYDSDYSPNEYSSESEDSVNITCIFLFLKVFWGLISGSMLIWVNTIFILRSAWYKNLVFFLFLCQNKKAL